MAKEQSCRWDSQNKQVGHLRKDRDFHLMMRRSNNLIGCMRKIPRKHARFIENTRKMFDPVLIEQKNELDKKRKERAEEKGWQDFYTELEHDELAGYGFDVENDRLYIKIHGKPSDEIRALLKKAALRWLPKNQRWQRILTVNAINSVNRNVMNQLGLPEMEDSK